MNVTTNIEVAENSESILKSDHVFHIVDDVADVSSNYEKGDNTVGFAGILHKFIYLEKGFTGKDAAHETMHSAGLPHIEDMFYNGKFGIPLKPLNIGFKKVEAKDYPRNLMLRGTYYDSNEKLIENGNKLERFQFNTMMKYFENTKGNQYPQTNQGLQSYEE